MPDIAAPLSKSEVAGLADWKLLTREARTIDTGDIGALANAALYSARTLADVVIRRLSDLLGNDEMRAGLLRDIFAEALAKDPSIVRAMRKDAFAILDRDPAAARLIEPMLFYKGFHAIELHRFSHWLWRQERHNLARWLQSRSSEVFQVDIHPAAKFGHGIFLDHATGFTVGETAEVDDNVSILHSVTLGGTGTDGKRRHPRIRKGVLIGSGAKLLGDIEVGEAAKVAAGSVVLQSVPAYATVAGVPAVVVSDPHRKPKVAPSQSMDQMLDKSAIESFTYVI